MYFNLTNRGALYSVNYDRIFHQSDKLTYSFNIGFSVLENVVALPVVINLFTGKGNIHLEFSLIIMP